MNAKERREARGTPLFRAGDRTDYPPLNISRHTVKCSTAVCDFSSACKKRKIPTLDFPQNPLFPPSSFIFMMNQRV